MNEDAYLILVIDEANPTGRVFVVTSEGTFPLSNVRRCILNTGIDEIPELDVSVMVGKADVISSRPGKMK